MKHKLYQKVKQIVMRRWLCKYSVRGSHYIIDDLVYNQEAVSIS